MHVIDDLMLFVSSSDSFVLGIDNGLWGQKTVCLEV
jgi:hypothetical protein